VEHLYLIQYTLNGQQESLDFLSQSETVSEEEVLKKVEAAIKPYGKTKAENIRIIKVHSADVIDTDPQTSASG
jgi:hypothetical protein